MIVYVKLMPCEINHETRESEDKKCFKSTIRELKYDLLPG